jgi:hypothetical protein
VKWNPKLRRYEDKNGKPIPPQQIRDYIEEFILAQKEDIDREHTQTMKGLASGILIAGFFHFMREKIKEMHGAAGVIAYGGEAEMNPKRWDRIGEKIASEVSYLKGFHSAVLEARQTTDEILHRVSLVAELTGVEEAILTTAPSQLVPVVDSLAGSAAADVVTTAEPLFDTLIWGEVGSRARMYADGTYSTWANSEKAREMDAGVLLGRRITEGDSNVCEDCENAASDEYVSLAELQDIGDSICTVNCRCTIEFSYEGVEPLAIDRDVYAGVGS